MNEGVVAEIGTYQELSNNKDSYFNKLKAPRKKLGYQTPYEVF